MRATTTRTRIVATCAAGLLAAAGLAACSADDPGSSADTGIEARDPAGGGSVEGPDGVAPEAGAAADARPGTVTTLDPVVSRTKVVRQASLAVQVPDVEEAAAEVRDIAGQQGGIVRSESISSDREATSNPPADGGTITVAVPADNLEATLDALADVGEVLSRTVTTDDVTTRYADTDSRVDSARASVERVRALMSTATELADVVTLEAELSRRQADLEALESQLAALEGQIALSPVTVDLRTEAAPPPDPDDTGFLAGLAAGWSALTTSATVLLTLVGALVPFLAAAAIVLVPPALWWRRRRPAPTAPTPAPPTGSA